MEVGGGGGPCVCVGGGVRKLVGLDGNRHDETETCV